MRDDQEIILIDDEYLKSLLLDIDQAKQSIDMEVYIFDDQALDYVVTKSLCSAAKRGVKIRILVDGVGTLSWGNNITKQMEDAGIQTKVFHPLPWIVWHWKRAAPVSDIFFSKLFYLLSSLNSRNHRKTCIIDKRIVYIGGANISDHLLNNQTENYWRDTSVRLTDININKIQEAYEDAWGRLPFKKRLLKLVKHQTDDPIFRLNNSWRAMRRSYRSLFKEISKSKEKIFITNSYFVPRNKLLRKLIQASRRGVNVILLLPNKSDIYISSLAAKMFYTILLKNGIHIYQYLPRMLHAKLMIIDDWYLLGTSNLNHRSLMHDLEVDVNITTQHAKQMLDEQFKKDLSQSKQLQLSEMNNMPLYKKILGRIILIARNWI